MSKMIKYNRSFNAEITGKVSLGEEYISEGFNETRTIGIVKIEGGRVEDILYPYLKTGDNVKITIELIPENKLPAGGYYNK